ncbi:MAG: hypothetical protein ACQ5SW_12380 [Sphaerochaetaceae bacterium]
MIIDGYVIPDDLKIEEFKTSDGNTLYYCNGGVSTIKSSLLYAYATARICEKCGAQTEHRFMPLCNHCEAKARRKKYLSYNPIEYSGQPVFVGDEFIPAGDLLNYLRYLNNSLTPEEFANIEIFEAALMAPPVFDMNEYLVDMELEDPDFDTAYDAAINALIKKAAGEVYEFGDNRITIPPEEWAEKLR